MRQALLGQQVGLEAHPYCDELVLRERHDDDRIRPATTTASRGRDRLLNGYCAAHAGGAHAALHKPQRRHEVCESAVDDELAIQLEREAGERHDRRGADETLCELGRALELRVALRLAPWAFGSLRWVFAMVACQYSVRAVHAW